MKLGTRGAATAVLATLAMAAGATSAQAVTGNAAVSTGCSSAGNVVLQGEFTNVGGMGFDNGWMYAAMQTAYGNTETVEVPIDQTLQYTVDTGLSAIPSGTVTFWFGGVYDGSDAHGDVDVAYAAAYCNQPPKGTISSCPGGKGWIDGYAQRKGNVLHDGLIQRWECVKGA